MYVFLRIYFRKKKNKNESTNEVLEIPINFLTLNNETKMPKDEMRQEDLYTPEKNAIVDSDDEGHQQHSETEDATSEIDETPTRKQTKRGPG